MKILIKKKIKKQLIFNVDIFFIKYDLFAECHGDGDWGLGINQKNYINIKKLKTIYKLFIIIKNRNN